MPQTVAMKPVPRRAFLLTAALPYLTPIAAVAQAAKARLRRKDCFFGIHLDLHPDKTDTALGRDLTEEMVERFLAQVKPDFVQYDCKGHPGYLGYPSATGNSAEGIINDSLAIWRKVTAAHGVALFVHFSGLWDSLSIQKHPDWASMHADGERDPNATSTFGPYVDQVMIPELQEVSAKYDLDGAWIDGECWAVRLDYSEPALRAFRESTGIAEAPKGPGQRGWQEFLEFNREAFRRYLRHYLEVMHQSRPRFQIASNWLYTTYVPERPEIPVDYLSGDYLGNASISAARLESRYLGATGKPWDLMAWGFQQGADSRMGFSHKPAAQLEQEASVVLAQGGGFQIYYEPTRAGHVDDRHIRVMARVARFCRERQALSHQSESIPQVGVLFSKTSLYRGANKLFGGWGQAVEPARGILDALLENQFSVDVIPDWKLGEVAARYPVIVVPDWPYIGLTTRESLVGYARAGGKLLLAGAENASLFSDVLGVRFTGNAVRQDAFIPEDEEFANVSGVWQPVAPGPGTDSIAQRYPTYDSGRDGACAATVNPLGSGEIAAVYGPLGKAFASTHAAAARAFVRRVMNRVFTPAVQVDGPPTVEIALRRKASRTALHLINCSQMQVASDYIAGNFVSPVGPVKIRVRAASRPDRVVLQPGGRSIAGEVKDGAWTGALDRLDTHAILTW
jgi:hypothetical protein